MCSEDWPLFSLFSFQQLCYLRAFSQFLGICPCHCTYTYGVVMPPPCWSLFKTALNNSSGARWTYLCSVVLCARTPPCGKGKQSFVFAWLEWKDLNLQILLPYFWVLSVTLEQLWVILACAIRAHMNELHGIKIRRLKEPQHLY